LKRPFNNGCSDFIHKIRVRAMDRIYTQGSCNAPIFYPGSPKPNWPRHRESAARAARLTLLLAAAPLSPSIASLACGATRRPSPTSTPSSPRHVPPTALSCPVPLLPPRAKYRGVTDILPHIPSLSSVIGREMFSLFSSQWRIH